MWRGRKPATRDERQIFVEIVKLNGSPMALRPFAKFAAEGVSSGHDFDGEAVSVEGLKHLDEATTISRFVSVASRQDDDTMPRWRPQQLAHLQLNTFVNVLFLAGHAPPLANIELDSSSFEVLFDRGALVH